jgi:hypothetical protein
VIADNCEDFEPKVITNGDKIRQMSNEKLKNVIDCPYPDDLCVHRHDEYPCECCKRDWLNAPAEREAINEETSIFQTEEKGEVE